MRNTFAGIPVPVQHAEVQRDTGYILAGEKIVSLRRELGLTQAEFAQRVGITEVAQRRIEKKPKARIQAGTLRGIAELLKISPAEAVLQLQPGDSPAPLGGISPEMLERITAAAAERGLTPDQFVTESLFGKPRKKK